MSDHRGHGSREHGVARGKRSGSWNDPEKIFRTLRPGRGVRVWRSARIPMYTGYAFKSASAVMNPVSLAWALSVSSPVKNIAPAAASVPYRVPSEILRLMFSLSRETPIVWRSVTTSAVVPRMKAASHWRLRAGTVLRKCCPDREPSALGFGERSTVLTTKMGRTWMR
jgi:hypothetical protein